MTDTQDPNDMNKISAENTNAIEEPSQHRRHESGKVHVKFFWKTGLIISIVVSIIGTILLNLILNS